MLDDKAALLQAMANEARLGILTLLLENEMPVGALVEKAGLSQSAVSQHLAKLRAENLVTTRRESQTIYYSCQSPAVKAIMATLDNIFAECDVGERRAA